MNQPHVVLCDLDGVVWLARRALPGSADAIAALRASGHRVVFVTNNSYSTREQQEQYLADCGIPAEGDVVTSAMAAASLVDPGSNVLICGGPGLVEAVLESGGFPIEKEAVEGHMIGGGNIDAVVVGFHRTFDYEALRLASSAIRRGARFIASNTDPTYPTAEGPIPGGGSIVAAVAAASGTAPEIAGKPFSGMANLVRSYVSGVNESTVMIGDRPSTDGSFARELCCRFALVRSDVTREEERAIRWEADFEGNSLQEVVQKMLA